MKATLSARHSHAAHQAAKPLRIGFGTSGEEFKFLR
jgi:hypothetical protein